MITKKKKVILFTAIFFVLFGIASFGFYKFSNRIIYIWAGYENTLIMRQNGEIDGVGKTYNAESWKDMKQISTGQLHVVGLRKDGTVVARGNNQNGQLNVSGLKDIVQISAIGDFTAALKKDGTLIVIGKSNKDSWFANYFFNVSNFKDVVAISDGFGDLIGIKKDGSIVVVGKVSKGKYNSKEWCDIVAVASGICTIGLKSNGTVVSSVADNIIGSDNKPFKFKTKNWKNVISIAVGGGFVIGLKKDGTVYYTANYPDIDLSLIGTENISKNITNYTNVVAISANQGHVVLLTADGIIHSFGWNEDSKTPSIYDEPRDYLYQRTQVDILNK